MIYDRADVLIVDSETLSKWKWPDVPGLENFEGTILHTARWDTKFNATGKNLAVLGSGFAGRQVSH